jgi:putative acetyltransferase
MDSQIFIRLIEEKDNPSMEKIIREVMSEFNADPKTTIIGDPMIKKMFSHYQDPRSVYFVLEKDGELLGGCGIASLPGDHNDICELQRMFIRKEIRKNGFGKKLLAKSIDSAKNFGYKKMYLETLDEMTSAISLYKKSGFKPLKKRLGMTGHSGCNVQMILDLEK